MPPVVLFVAKSPLVAKYDLSSVLATIIAAAPLSKEIEDEACKVMGIKNIYQGKL